MEKFIARVTKCVREADAVFETVGGSSRHWVRDCFMPELKKEGLTIIDTSSTTDNSECTVPQSEIASPKLTS